MSNHIITDVVRIWKIDTFKIIDKPTDTEVAVYRNRIVFKPTNSEQDNVQNIMILKKRVKFGNVTVGVHTGFYDKLMSVQERLFSHLITSGVSKDVIFSGHSQGGAMAQLTAIMFKTMYPQSKVACYSFGSPKVGDSRFAELYNREIDTSFRIYYGMDPVPVLPPLLGYVHTKNPIWIDPVTKSVINGERRVSLHIKSLVRFVVTLLGIKLTNDPWKDHGYKNIINSKNDILFSSTHI